MYVGAWCLWRPEEGVGPPGTGVIGTGAVMWVVGPSLGTRIARAHNCHVISLVSMFFK